MTELLTVPEMLSPRLRWLAKFCVVTCEMPEAEDGGPWFAFVRLPKDADKSPVECLQTYWDYSDGQGLGSGATLDDAIVDLAKKLHLKLWNEEP